MDAGRPSEDEQGATALTEPDEESPRPRQLPSDLPTSLDDRRAPATFDTGVEVYDAWQGKLGATCN